MRDQIELALNVLVGKSLWASHRAADMEMFQFGGRVAVTNHRGEPGEVGEYALHIQCPWRVVGLEGISVGSGDLYYPPGDAEGAADFDYDGKQSRRDRRLLDLFQTEAEDFLVVEDVQADDVGSLRLTFSQGYALELFPADSLLMEDNEHWRFFRPGLDNPHFVVSGLGITD
jgi:hypothetical protein